MASWIIKFTIMIFLSKVWSNGICNSEEVGHVNCVTDIGVEVVLEVLKHVHVLHNVLISSNSWEGEGFIEEFPGMDWDFWCSTSLFTNLCLKVQDVGPVSWVKGSWEHINLIVKLSISLIKIDAIWFWCINGGINLNELVIISEVEEFNFSGRN